MKAVTQDLLDEAVAARLAGATHKAVLEQFGLSHSQFEFAWLRQVEMAEVAGKTEATVAEVVRLRTEGESWGRIAVHCGCTESRVRKLFSEAGSKSQGLRIGKGGRWYYNEQELYRDGLVITGTEIPTSEPYRGRSGALQAAAEAKLALKPIQELRAEHKALTGKLPNRNWSPVQIARHIAKLRTVQEG